MTAPYKPGDRIVVTHDTEAGRRVTEQVTVQRTVRLNDHRTWRVETDRHGGGVMHLYVDAHNLAKYPATRIRGDGAETAQPQ